MTINPGVMAGAMSQQAQRIAAMAPPNKENFANMEKYAVWLIAFSVFIISIGNFVISNRKELKKTDKDMLRGSGAFLMISSVILILIPLTVSPYVPVGMSILSVIFAILAAANVGNVRG